MSQASFLNAVASLNAQGMSDQQIADALGKSRPTVSRARSKRLGLESPFRRAKASREKAIMDLHGEGLTDAEIANRVGLAESSIPAIRRGLGLANNQPKPEKPYFSDALREDLRKAKSAFRYSKCPIDEGVFGRVMAVYEGRV